MQWQQVENISIEMWSCCRGLPVVVCSAILAVSVLAALSSVAGAPVAVMRVTRLGYAMGSVLGRLVLASC